MTPPSLLQPVSARSGLWPFGPMMCNRVSIGWRLCDAHGDRRAGCRANFGDSREAGLEIVERGTHDQVGLAELLAAGEYSAPRRRRSLQRKREGSAFRTQPIHDVLNARWHIYLFARLPREVDLERGCDWVMRVIELDVDATAARVHQVPDDRRDRGRVALVKEDLMADGPDCWMLHR